MMSLRHGSYFSNSKLSIELILRLILLWIKKTPVSKAASELEIRKGTVVDWYNFNRDVCAQYFIDHPVKIGGPNVEVEIDESKFNWTSEIQQGAIPGGTLGVWRNRKGNWRFFSS